MGNGGGNSYRSYLQNEYARTKFNGTWKTFLSQSIFTIIVIKSITGLLAKKYSMFSWI
jgi:hypothetical protein